MAYKEQQRVAEMEAREAERDGRKKPAAEPPRQETDDSADPAP
jgi:hypothetical protein